MGLYKTNRELHQDSGWNWIVAFAAFTAHLITHGIVYSFGILFLRIQDNFHGTKAQISWIPSLTTGSLYLIGPVASILINRHGCRTVTIFGSILGCLGYFASVFVEDLYYLYITMGIIAGCGFGMVFLPSILIVTKCFNEYRALACGFALSGAGSGAFIFSPLLEHLVNVYSLKGTLLLISAIILNCIPCGLLYHSMSVQKNTPDKHMLEDSVHLTGSTENVKDEGQNLVYSKCEPILADVEITNIQNEDDSKFKELVHGDSVVIEVVHDGLVQKKVTLDSSMENRDVMDERKSLCTRYTSLLKCREVLTFFVSQFLFFAGFYLPFIYIPDKAKSQGIQEEDAAWIASTIGISSITGRIVLGYLADRPCVNRMIMFKIALLLTGVSTSFIPVFNTLWLLLIYAVIYGIATGITLSLTSVVLVDIAGIELLAEAMGLNNFFSAFGSLLGPPVAGLLYDLTETYTASFLASGITMTVAGILLILATLYRRK